MVVPYNQVAASLRNLIFCTVRHDTSYFFIAGCADSRNHSRHQPPKYPSTPCTCSRTMLSIPCWLWR